MDKIVVRSAAKINLDFKIIGKRPDGYHDIESTVQTIDICDTLTFTKRDTGLVVTGNVVAGVPDDLLVTKAIKALELEVGRKLPCEVHLDKCIPIAAGLGGGSSNAAATLAALDILYDLGISRETAYRIGVELGADVPLFLWAGLCRIEGKGDRVTPLEENYPDDVTPIYVVFRPHKRLSSREAYEEWDRIGRSFADQALEKCPWLQEIFGVFPDAMVSGKGPSVWVRRYDYDEIRDITNALLDWDGDIFIARPCLGYQVL